MFHKTCFALRIVRLCQAETVVKYRTLLFPMESEKDLFSSRCWRDMTVNDPA